MNKVIIVYFQNKERASKYDSKELVRAILKRGDNMNHMSVIMNEPSLVSRLMMIDSAVEYRHNHFEKSDYLIVTDSTKDLPLRYMGGFAYVNIDEYIDIN